MLSGPSANDSNRDTDHTYRSGTSYNTSDRGSYAGSSTTYGTNQSDPANRRGTTLTADSRFINDASVGGLTEVRMGQLAAQQQGEHAGPSRVHGH